MIAIKSSPTQSMKQENPAVGTEKSAEQRNDLAFELLLGLMGGRFQGDCDGAQLPSDELVADGKRVTDVGLVTASIAGPQSFQVSTPTAVGHDLTDSEALGGVSALLDASVAALRRQGDDPMVGAQLGLEAARKAFAALNAQADQNLLTARLAAAVRGDRAALQELISDGFLAKLNPVAVVPRDFAIEQHLQESIQGALSGRIVDGQILQAQVLEIDGSTAPLQADEMKTQGSYNLYSGADLSPLNDGDADASKSLDIFQREGDLPLLYVQDSRAPSNSQSQGVAGIVSSQPMIEPTVNWLLSQQGGGATIDLTPPDLGHVRVELKLDSAGQHATLVVHPSSDAAKASIEQSLSRLVDVFAASGMQLSVSVESGQSGLGFARERERPPRDLGLDRVSSLEQSRDFGLATRRSTLSESGLSLYV
jgi:hypothetical protein